MRYKIIALTANALKARLLTHPASPEAVAGMETALIALNGVLSRLTFFNVAYQAWYYKRQLDKEISDNQFQAAEQAALIEKLKTQLRERTQQQITTGRIIDRQDVEMEAQRRQIESLQAQLLGAGSGNTPQFSRTQRSKSR